MHTMGNMMGEHGDGDNDGAYDISMPDIGRPDLMTCHHLSRIGQSVRLQGNPKSSLHLWTSRPCTVNVTAMIDRLTGLLSLCPTPGS